MRSSMPPDLLVDLSSAHELVGSRWEALRGGHVFVTGGTGFVGKWLLATLLDADARRGLGCRISVLTRNPAAFRAEVPWIAEAPGLRLIQGDVRSFDPDIGPVTHVIHAATDVAAAAGPIETFDTCVEGTRRVLDGAVRSGCRSVLLLSSGAVYGRQPSGLDAIPETWFGGPDVQQPGSAYAEGKRASEWLGSACAASTGIRVTAARCFAFVGPFLPLDKHFAIGNFLRDALANRTIVIKGDGTPWRTYLHASEMAAWLWAILLEGRSMTAYNVGGSEAVTIAQLAQRVVDAVGSLSAIQVLASPAPGASAERYVPDVSRVLSEFGLPAPCSLDEAIARTVRWHQHRHQLS